MYTKVADRSSDAELLIDAVDVVREIDGLAIAENCSVNSVALIALGFKLRSSRPGFIFKAIVEDWDTQRLVRELY